MPGKGGGGGDSSFPFSVACFSATFVPLGKMELESETYQETGQEFWLTASVHRKAAVGAVLWNNSGEGRVGAGYLGGQGMKKPWKEFTQRHQDAETMKPAAPHLGTAYLREALS